jgi:hypothetical protein
MSVQGHIHAEEKGVMGFRRPVLHVR